VGETRRKRRQPPTAIAPDLGIFLLRIDLADATYQRDAAQWGQDPFERAFKAAHACLSALPPRTVVGKSTRLAAYDARMKAGHAWHPHRTRLREATRWIKAIKEDMDWYE
jgi:hypothetical protein